MKAFAATVAVSTLLVLALGPMQLQGLPGHLRTHDGSMAENQEMEKAVIEALLAVAQQDKNTAANKQYLPYYLEDQATDEKKSQTAQQQQYPLIQQFMSEMARNQQVQARNQRIQNRREQSAKSQQVQENAIAQQSGVTIEYCGPVGDIIQNSLRFGLGFIPGGDSAYGVYIACAEQPTYPCTTVTVAVPANSIKADIDVCDLNNDGNICVDVYAANCNPGLLAIPLPITVPVGSNQVQVIIKVDAFGGCASVEVYAPKC